MKKFICVRGWKRNPTGEVIEEWQYNKLPDEVKNRNFKEVVPEPIVKPVTITEILTAAKSVHPKFKPFNVADDLTKNEE